MAVAPNRPSRPHAACPTSLRRGTTRPSSRVDATLTPTARPGRPPQPACPARSHWRAWSRHLCLSRRLCVAVVGDGRTRTGKAFRHRWPGAPHRSFPTGAQPSSDVWCRGPGPGTLLAHERRRRRCGDAVRVSCSPVGRTAGAVEVPGRRGGTASGSYGGYWGSRVEGFARRADVRPELARPVPGPSQQDALTGVLSAGGTRRPGPGCQEDRGRRPGRVAGSRRGRLLGAGVGEAARGATLGAAAPGRAPAAGDRGAGTAAGCGRRAGAAGQRGHAGCGSAAGPGHTGPGAGGAAGRHGPWGHVPAPRRPGAGLPGCRADPSDGGQRGQPGRGARGRAVAGRGRAGVGRGRRGRAPDPGRRRVVPCSYGVVTRWEPCAPGRVMAGWCCPGSHGRGRSGAEPCAGRVVLLLTDRPWRLAGFQRRWRPRP